MKTNIRKLIALSLSLLFCFSPLAARAQSLLGDRLTKAFDAGKTIEVSVSLDLDDNLAMFGLMPQESFAAAQEALRATTLSVSVTRADADQAEIGFALRMRETLIADGRAWQEGDKLAVTTSLLPGKTLLMDAAALLQGFMGPMEQLTAQVDDLQSLGASGERILAVAYEWLNATPGLVANGEGGPATSTRDASVQSMTLRVTPEQLKELLTKVAQALAEDETLAKALSLDGMGVEPLEAIASLAPTDNAMEWTVYLDAQGGVAAVDGSVPQMFGEGATVGRFSYEHLSAGRPVLLPLEDAESEWHRLGGQITEEGVGATSFSLEIAGNQSDPNAPNGSVQARFRQSNQESATTMALSHTYAHAFSENRQTLECQTSIDLQTQQSTAASDDPAAAILSSMGDSAFSAALDFSGDTRVRGQDDFTCESALGISVMGMPLGRVLVTLASNAHVPADTTGNEAIDLDALDEAGQAALSEALNAGLGNAAQSALAQLPPELLLLIQGMQ